MIRRINQFEYGENSHTVYQADDVGDVLPPGLHDHTYDHLCVLMSGEIEAYFDDRESIEAKVGDPPFHFLAGRKHGIRAKTDGAMFMNIARVV